MTATTDSIICIHKLTDGRCTVCGHTPSSTEARLARAAVRLRAFQQRKPVDMGRLAMAMKTERKA